MVPARHRRQAPGVDHHKIGRQRGPGQDIGVHAHPRDQGRRRQKPHPDQGGDMQGIDPRHPRPQEAAIRETLLARRLQIDVAEDEARQDEEQFDAQIPFGHQAGLARAGQVFPEGVDGDPDSRAETQGRDGLQIGGGLDGGHGVTLARQPCRTVKARKRRARGAFRPVQPIQAPWKPAGRATSACQVATGPSDMRATSKTCSSVRPSFRLTEGPTSQA